MRNTLTHLMVSDTFYFIVDDTVFCPKDDKPYCPLTPFLFKLNRPRRLTGNIIEAAVYPLHFIDNPAHNSL